MVEPLKVINVRNVGHEIAEIRSLTHLSICLWFFNMIMSWIHLINLNIVQFCVFFLVIFTLVSERTKLVKILIAFVINSIFFVYDINWNTLCRI